MRLAELCYGVTALFPQGETFGLASQFHRAAVSIPSNIAEGHSRRSRQAFLNHLSIALGLQAELETQIELASRLSLISQIPAKQILQEAEEIGRMLHGLIRSLERAGGQALAPSP
jgi:four helix bundle protein